MSQSVGLALELRHLQFQVFIFIEFDLQESDRNSRLFFHTLRGKVIEIGALAFVLAKVVYLDQAFFDQRLQAVIDASETDPKFASDVALGGLRVVFEKLENAVSVFVGQHRLVFND